MRKLIPKKIDVVILCGGLGTRLKIAVNDRPKPMAEIGGKPFLDILIKYIFSFGFRRFLLCTGYKGDVISAHIKKSYNKAKGDFLVIREKKRLRTGGAVKNAASFIKSDIFMVLNGDSFCKVDLLKFMDFHKFKKAKISMVLSKVSSNADCGVVELGSNSEVSMFKEKGLRAEKCLVNAGIYLFDKDVFGLFPLKESFSLENDFFPSLQGCIFGFVTAQPIIDIGTPGRYKKAQLFFGAAK
ncbi:MAG: NTP transferase domain-containing protein [Candidatus Omnitrophica bacterium]|nr:NTP transferase domain-containing protein [Candidatus Omnitrophota bacterium]